MIRVIDFETTGLPPDADVIEAACVDVLLKERRLDDVAGWSTFVRPIRPIGVEARAAHHISDAEAAQGSPWEEVKHILMHVEFFCAHNADFEKSFFNPEGSRWIDTYKCALRLFPEAPKHTNSVLRYYLPDCDPGELGMPPHRALPDCYVTARILIQCLKAASIEQLVTWSAEPPLLPRIPMGKHRTKKWDDPTVPTDYLEWCSRQDFDAGVAHTVRVELAKRRKR